MGIVRKQTMRHCFNTFNTNLLIPKSLNLHENINKTAQNKKFLVFMTIFLQVQSSKDRGSRPVVFCKKGALRNFVKFKGNQLCQSPSPDEFTCSCELCEIFKNTFL